AVAVGEPGVRGRVSDPAGAGADRTPGGQGPASMAARTFASVGVESNPVRHQVAPAAAHGDGSVPGGFVTTTSNGAAERAPARPARREPDRDARALQRTRLELAVPEGRQPLERGVEQPRLLGGVGDLAERREL